MARFIFTESGPITAANLDALRENIGREPWFREPCAIIGPRAYEWWQELGDGIHPYLGHVPWDRVLLNHAIGYDRSEYTARCQWLGSEWHR